jgi:nucleoside-diphosphate-sugar epimerase
LCCLLLWYTESLTNDLGLVGGHIILQLLARGESPESIRLVDFNAPNRADMLTGPASRVPFIKTDIASQSSVREAFTQLWPEAVSSLPLTVFLTAATIHPSDRAKSLYPKYERVNVTGTANVLSATKAAGADVFISTSSAPVCMPPPNFWIAPWKSHPDGYVQLLDDKDVDQPLRPHEQYFSNYAVSKARAERIVLAANSATLKTGSIRPACGIYGNRYDQTVGQYLRRGVIPT